MNKWKVKNKDKWNENEQSEWRERMLYSIRFSLISFTHLGILPINIRIYERLYDLGVY